MPARRGEEPNRAKSQETRRSMGHSFTLLLVSTRKCEGEQPHLSPPQIVYLYSSREPFPTRFSSDILKMDCVQSGGLTSHGRAAYR
jgi:hypothetical protein